MIFSEEAEGLSELPELLDTPFPFRGRRDFRGFTEDDYDNFSAGVFQSSDDPSKLKWFGGRLKFEVAHAKLLELGYACEVKEPHIAEIGNEADGYQKFEVKWHTILFCAIAATRPSSARS